MQAIEYVKRGSGRYKILPEGERIAREKGWIP